MRIQQLEYLEKIVETPNSFSSVSPPSLKP